MSCVDKKDAGRKFGPRQVPDFHFWELFCTFFRLKMLCFGASNRVWIKKMSLFLPPGKGISGLDEEVFLSGPVCGWLLCPVFLYRLKHLLGHVSVNL